MQSNGIFKSLQNFLWSIRIIDPIIVNNLNILTSFQKLSYEHSNEGNYR